MAGQSRNGDAAVPSSQRQPESKENQYLLELMQVAIAVAHWSEIQKVGVED